MRIRRAARTGFAPRGFTLIELMIVVSIIAIVAAIAVPNLISARMNANEATAISILRTISTAQAQFQKSQKADEDGDAQGEYGVLGELSGRTDVRGTAARVPTDLSNSMGSVDANGEVQRHGYIYRCYLPETGGHGVREEPLGGVAAGVVDPDLCETTWGCYAWPVTRGMSGNRSFFVNQHCEIVHTDDLRYDGANDPDIQAGSAFLTADIASMTASLATGTVAADGNFWKPVQ